MKKETIARILLTLILTSISFSPFASAKAYTHKSIIYKNEVTRVTLNAYQRSIVSEKTFLLKLNHLSSGTTVQFKSLNNSIATVDSIGLITGITPGTTTIKVTMKHGRKKLRTLKCMVKVGPPAFSVLIAKKTVTLLVGDNKILRTYTKPKNSVEKPIFISSNPIVAMVNNKGVVTARAVGTAVITTSIENGKNDTCLITVTENNEDTPTN